MTILRRLQLRQKAQSIGRPLECPVCGFRFAFRHHERAGRCCPQCKVPIGYPPWYRKLLGGIGILTALLVMYFGSPGGDAANGWLLVGWPFAFIAAVGVQGFVLRAFPPKLEAHAEGDTWLKLT